VIVLCFSDGMRWAHLSCALWIPEIIITDTEKMEPVGNIADIPVCFIVSPSTLFFVVVLIVPAFSCEFPSL